VGKGGQTIGYHYMMDLLFGLARGPINQLRAIMVGDKIAWEADACGGDVQAISKPDLFGGKKKEGGIQGPFRLLLGAKDQVLPGSGSANSGATGPLSGTQTLPDVKDAISDGDADKRSLISEFRGTTMLWFSGLICSMNPYPKEWSFRLRRYSAGWYDDDCWYPAKSVIFLDGGKIHAMNPAHILFQCYTDPSWGRGLPWSKLDENSFIYSANLFCSESFGLCFNWQRKGQELDSFMDTVCEHAGIARYTDPQTGKIVIKPIRNDYVADDLPLFHPGNGLLDIKDEDSSSQDEIFNEIIGSGHDPITNKPFQLRVHNLAARTSQGAPNAQEKEYKGIPTKDLLLRALQRDLRETALGLKKKTVVLDRRGWKLRPGMVFRISDTRRGIANMVLRVGEITDRSHRDGRITVKAMQDVWGLPESSFVTPVEGSWTPPLQTAVPAAAERIVEANWRDLVLGMPASERALVEPTDAFIGVVAQAGDPSLYQYELVSRAAGEPAFADGPTGAFTGSATLAAAITILQTSFEVAGERNFDAANIGQAILVDDEQMELTAYDPVTHVVTVKRGVADTVPEAHSAGARAWTIDDDLVGDERTYVSGEDVEAKVLPRTSSDLLAEGDAATLAITLAGRQGRPYPPAGVTVDGLEALTLVQTTERPEPEIDWVHRDRLLQDDQLVGYAEAGVGPEPGTTYNIRIYDAEGPDADPPLRTVSGLASGPWTYDAAMQAADGAPAIVRVELESERDGLASHQHHRLRIPLRLSGYGFGYGLGYGA